MQYHQQEPWGTQLRKLATSIPSGARSVFSKSWESFHGCSPGEPLHHIMAQTTRIRAA